MSDAHALAFVKNCGGNFRLQVSRYWFWSFGLSSINGTHNKFADVIMIVRRFYLDIQLFLQLTLDVQVFPTRYEEFQVIASLNEAAKNRNQLQPDMLIAFIHGVEY